LANQCSARTTRKAQQDTTQWHRYSVLVQFLCPIFFNTHHSAGGLRGKFSIPSLPPWNFGRGYTWATAPPVFSPHHSLKTNVPCSANKYNAANCRMRHEQRNNKSLGRQRSPPRFRPSESTLQIELIHQGQRLVTISMGAWTISQCPIHLIPNGGNT
jgi:hypothetical protein